MYKAIEFFPVEWGSSPDKIVPQFFEDLIGKSNDNAGLEIVRVFCKGIFWDNTTEFKDTF